MKMFPIQKFACVEKLKLHAALLSVPEQTHVYARQALNCSINMCYASELQKILGEKFVNGR